MKFVRPLLLVAGVVAVALAVAEAWRTMGRYSAVDFYLVYVNEQVAGRPDVPNIYTPEAQVSIGEEFYQRAIRSGLPLFIADATVRRSLDSRGSPFLYASMAWVSDRYDTALLQYRVVLLAAFCGGILILGAYCGVPLYATLFLLAGLIRFFLPFRADFIVGNVNAMQLFLLAVVLVLLERFPRLAGAILAMMVAAKPTLILVVVVLFGSRLLTREYRRFFREVTGAAIGAVIAVVVGSFWFGTPRAWLLWFDSAGGLWEMLLAREFNNVAPALRLFQQYGGWISYAIAAALLVIAAVPVLRSRKRDDLLLISLGLLIYFLSSKLVWLHYLLLTIPATFALLRNRWTAPIAIGALILMADEPYRLLLGASSPDSREPLITVSLVALYTAAVWMLPHRTFEKRPSIIAS